MGKVRIDHPSFMPIWEEMEEKGYVLAVDLSPGAEQVPQMEKILAHFPSLRVAIGHFGMVTRGNWLSQIRLAKHKHVYIEMGGIIWLFRKEGYPFPNAIRSIQQAKKEVGIQKLMWGSDWPRTMVDFTYGQSLEFLRKESNGLTTREKNFILGENAARLYKFKHPRVRQTPVALITEG
jgi:predicted TIM-barrel fold metal-dependent hydrolase